MPRVSFAKSGTFPSITYWLVSVRCGQSSVSSVCADIILLQLRFFINRFWRKFNFFFDSRLFFFGNCVCTHGATNYYLPTFEKKSSKFTQSPLWKSENYCLLQSSVKSDTVLIAWSSKHSKFLATMPLCHIYTRLLCPDMEISESCSNRHLIWGKQPVSQF